MIAAVQQRDGSYKTQEREPECNKDFCDQCGDCLVCYGGDRCVESADGKHLWVVYLNQ